MTSAPPDPRTAPARDDSGVSVLAVIVLLLGVITLAFGVTDVAFGAVITGVITLTLLWQTYRDFRDHSALRGRTGAAVGAVLALVGLAFVLLSAFLPSLGEMLEILGVR